MYLNTRASIHQDLCDESIRLLSQADYLHNESIRLFRDSLQNRQNAIQNVLCTKYRRRDAIQCFWQAENLRDSAAKLVSDTFYNRKRAVRLVLDTHIFHDNLIRGGVKMEYTATVVRVIDGDTIDVEVPLQTGVKRLRLAGIDTPEKGTQGAADATDYLKILIQGSPVTIKEIGVGVFGRPLVHVWRNYDGMPINRRMIETGYAKLYSRN